MEYGINIGLFTKYLPTERVAEMIAKAGFTLLDYTPPLLEEDWRARMLADMRVFDAFGLAVHQTHMPFNRYGRYGDKHRLCMDRCVEASAHMGAKYIAVHGDEFDKDAVFTPEAALAYNHELFRPYVESAGAAGIKLAFETVFDETPAWRRFTSRREELLALIRSFDSEHAVCCFDFGHANVAFGKELPLSIAELGSLIQCVHLHDNAGNDSHQMPMTGDIDWQATVNALRAIPYRGALCIEYAHGCVPEALLPDFLSLTCRAAKYLWEGK